MSEQTKTAPAMTGASMSVVDGEVVISNVHHSSGEGFSLTIRANGWAVASDHYYDDKIGAVVVESKMFPHVAEAVAYIAEVTA